ncbi:MAG: MYXO-CTERM sorting domain-containing protein, partial [Polyangia bacterium]
QSMPQTLGAGEMQPAWVEFKNTGTATWEPGVTHLGTTDPRDRDSALSSPDWLSANRAASVDATTKPGETGRFTFSLRGPVVSAAEALTEHFGLVQEGVAWFPDAASLTVDVMITPAAVSGGDPAEGTEGGVTPTGPSMGAHGGCSVGGRDETPVAGIALLLVGLTLFGRRRASYSSGRCRASVDSSSSSSSRSR